MSNRRKFCLKGVLTLLTLLILEFRINSASFCNRLTCNLIQCSNITTSDDVLSATNTISTFVKKNDHSTLWLENCNVTVLTESFFAAIKVRDLGLNIHKCNMKQVPYKLINSLSDSLTNLRIDRCIIEDETIANEFKKNEKMTTLKIESSTISIIERRAFEHFPNLKQLRLFKNNIKSVHPEAFKGLDKLEYLDIINNQLNALDKELFQPLENSIQHVCIKENNFHCDCNLQWLQTWFHNQSASNSSFFYCPDQKMLCTTPVKGDLATLNFCNQSESIQTKDSACPCIISKLKTLLNYDKKCNYQKKNAKLRMMCTLLNAQKSKNLTQQQIAVSKSCNCKLENSMAKKYVIKDCNIKAKGIFFVPKGDSKDKHYGCHLDRFQGLSNMHTNCTSVKISRSYSFCKFTSTPFLEQQKDRNNVLPEGASWLDSSYCKTMSEFENNTKICF